MSTKHQNPYSEETSYGKIFGYIQKKQVVTRQDIEAQGFPKHDITVVMSPRAEGKSRGDIRGNMSAKGHIYYMEALSHKKGEPKKFRLRWRTEVLDQHKRIAKKKEEVVAVVPEVAEVVAPIALLPEHIEIIAETPAEIHAEIPVEAVISETEVSIPAEEIVV